VQIRLWNGLHLKSCDDSIPAVYLVTTNVADRYGSNLSDLVTSEVRLLISGNRGNIFVNVDLWRVFIVLC